VTEVEDVSTKVRGDGGNEVEVPGDESSGVLCFPHIPQRPLHILNSLECQANRNMSVTKLRRRVRDDVKKVATGHGAELTI
jgi:hypothetical protein